MDVALLNSISNNTGKAVESQTSLANDFDTFLTLLTTQLQNQDPLEPMDSSEFTNQLVQFSTVEQTIRTNQNLENLVGLTASQMSSDAVGYIGKEINALGDTAVLKDGNAEWSYAFEVQSDQTTVLIKDEEGKIVYTAQGEKSSGAHDFVWDGKDNAGNPLSDGVYTLDVTAVDANGGPITVATGIKGHVTSVTLIGDQPLLTMGDISVPLSDVLSVSKIEPDTESESGS